MSRGWSGRGFKRIAGQQFRSGVGVLVASFHSLYRVLRGGREAAERSEQENNSIRAESFFLRQQGNSEKASSVCETGEIGFQGIPEVSSV